MSDKTRIDPEEFEKTLKMLIKKREDWEKKRLENIKKLLNKEKLRKVSKAELIKVLIDIMDQACGVHDEKYGDHVDSYATSSYAEALYLLADLGVFEIEDSYARRVIGRWKKGVWGEDI